MNNKSSRIIYKSGSNSKVLQNKDANIFAAIPEDRRGRFVERFRQLIEYRRTKQWDKLADLLSNTIKRGSSKEEIIQNCRKHPGVAGTNHKLTDFVVKDIKFQTVFGGTWIVSGCARLSGVKKRIDAFVVAWWENEDWYFSDVDAFIPRDTEFAQCSYETTSQTNK